MIWVMIKDLLISMRPAQWIKNLIVFAGIVFAREIFDLTSLGKVSLTFLLFCLLVGSNYLINDVKDVEKDKLHPQKRLRPIPSGSLPVHLATGVGVTGLLVSLGGAFLLDFRLGSIALVYIVLMLLYTYLLKEIAIVDAFVIAAGFILRAMAGVEVIKVEFSPWLLICATLLALFIVFSKRRHELILLEEGAVEHRKILEEYSSQLLDQMISVVTASTVVAYALYTLWPDTVLRYKTTNLVYTVPLVMYGIFRYLYLVYKKEEAGSPEKALLTDFPMLAAIALWILSIFLIVYR